MACRNPKRQRGIGPHLRFGLGFAVKRVMKTHAIWTLAAGLCFSAILVLGPTLTRRLRITG